MACNKQNMLAKKMSLEQEFELYELYELMWLNTFLNELEMEVQSLSNWHSDSKVAFATTYNPTLHIKYNKQNEYH